MPPAWLDIHYKGRYKDKVPLASRKPSSRPSGRDTQTMKLKLLYGVCLACLFVSIGSASAQVIISEFMADNKKTLADEDGQY